MMKKILTLLVMIALATCWIACSDDDKDEPDQTTPTMNEITLSIKMRTGEKLTLFQSPGEFFSRWKEEILPYINNIPQDLEVNWGDGQITNSTTHQYDLEGTYQVTIKGTGITSVVLEDHYYYELLNIDITKAPNLILLSIYKSHITTLDISKNFNLVYLLCDDNKLTSLDVSKNTKLKMLDCGDNNLSSIDVSKNTELVELYYADNNLTALDVSNNIALKYLYCQRNKLTSLNLSKNTKLTDLLCFDNQLTSLDLNKNTELVYLDCEENPFTQESVNNLLNSLPVGKYDNGEAISILRIDDKWDVSIAEEKGWKINFIN